MPEDNLIDLAASVRDLKGKLSERWSTEHTHFMEFMREVIPAANLVGEPLVSIGWKHVVQRVEDWHLVLTQQRAVLDLVMDDLEHGRDIADVQALLRIQLEALESVLAPWEPVPKTPAKE